MQCSSFTSAGIRAANEDTIHPAPGEPAGSLFVVADGLGGHADGQAASELACRALRQVLEREDPATFVIGGQRMGEEELWLAFLSDAVRQAGAAVWHEARRRGSDMGSTLLAVALANGRGYAAHVGDCALFISEQGELPPAKLTAEHRRGTGLTRSLGAQEQVTPDVFSFAFDEESALVMGCDGFWEHVTPGRIEQLLLERPPFCVAEELGRAALQAGSQDNVSVIVVLGDAFVARHAGGQMEGLAAVLSAADDGPESAAQRQALLGFATQHAAASPRAAAIIAGLLDRLPNAAEAWVQASALLPQGILDQVSQMVDLVALAPPAGAPTEPTAASAPVEERPAVDPVHAGAAAAPDGWPAAAPIEEPRPPTPAGRAAGRDAEYLARIEQLEVARARLQRELEAARATLREQEEMLCGLQAEVENKEKSSYTYRKAILRLGGRLLDLWQAYPKECEQFLTRDWLITVEDWLQQQGLDREPRQDLDVDEGKSLWDRIRHR